MKAMMSLDGLLDLINTFSLSASNKRWLAERLIEEAREEESKPTHLSASKFYGVWKDEDYPETSADELAQEIRASRKFREDVTML